MIGVGTPVALHVMVTVAIRLSVCLSVPYRTCVEARPGGAKAVVRRTWSSV